MPTTSFDTFFACTIIVAAALIATAFIGSTMQARINSTPDINKDSYLKAIAQHIITNPGTPLNWGTSNGVPEDFGLATSPSTIPYELDLDKISRLNNQNNSLSYAEISNAAKLNNIALGITVSQILSINIEQSDNHTIGNQVSYTFTISTNIGSKPTSASLHCYVAANSYLSDITNNTSNTGVGHITVQLPNAATGNALLIVFARTSFDDRITSYAIYNFAYSAQESTPSSAVLALSPLNYTLSIIPNSPDVTIQKGYIFSYTYQENITSASSTECPIPKIIDKSPLVMVICGLNGTTYFQEWTSYPQIPLRAGSDFDGSEKNVFGYIVTIKETLYKLDISFGDVIY